MKSVDFSPSWQKYHFETFTVSSKERLKITKAEKDKDKGNEQNKIEITQSLKDSEMNFACNERHL